MAQQMSKTNRKPEIQWIARNPMTRKFEVIDIEVAEILPGQTVMKTFLSNDQYVTIPGDCIYRMDSSHQLVLEIE